MSQDYMTIPTSKDAKGKIKQQGLKFNLGTLKHIGVITKADPLDFNVNFSNLAEVYRFVFIVVYAGLLSNADSKNVEPDFSDKDVEKWINEWDLTQAAEVITKFNAAYQLSGEEGANTQR